MKDFSHVTDLNYLEIEVKRELPSFIIKLARKVTKYVMPVLLKILAPVMGFGRVLNNVFVYDEYFLELEDGTKLATTVYLPKNIYRIKGKCPTILIRLPYWKDGVYCLFGYAFASFGYVVVMQDARGCAHSDGFNFFLMTEREDGLQTLKWISEQFWYNGKIGMSGGSYFGMTQLVLSWDNDLLTCIAPAICSISNLWRGNNGLNIHSLTTSIYRIMISIVINREKPIVDTFTKEIQELYLNPRFAFYNEPIEKKGKYLKFSNFKGLTLDECVKELSEFYKIEKWDLSKRNYKIYFNFLKDFLKLEKDIDTMPGMIDIDLKKFSQPAFILGGWYDMFLDHQLREFKEIKANAPGDAGKYSKLIIGPWAHGDKGHPDGSLVDFGKEFLKKGWYDYWLKDKKTAYPEIDKPSIRYWVMSKNIWRYTEEWPPENVGYKKLYIHSKGKANSVNGVGILNFEEPLMELEDNYMFNPLNPVITQGGRNLGILKGAVDQKDAEKRKDVLVYSTEPLERGIEITGPVKVVLYASSSVKDTDFMIKLVDVYPKGKLPNFIKSNPKGRAMNILDAGIRARFRNGEEKTSLIEPGKIIKYEFNLGNTSNYFGPGHRIRIEITSSNFPRFDINSNMGGEGGPRDYIIADQKIFHNSEYPSHIIIPVFK